MIFNSKHLTSISFFSLVVGLMIFPTGIGVAQDAPSSKDASLLEKPTETTDSTGSERENSDEQRATVAKLIKQGNDAYVAANYEAAVTAYSQALELFKQNAYAYYNRGNAYRKLKNQEAAFEDYTTALTLNPKNHYAHYYRGLLLADSGEYDNAIRDLSTALELNSQNPVFFEKRGDVYKKLKDKKAANRDYDKAIELYGKQGKDRNAELLRRRTGRVRR